MIQVEARGLYTLISPRFNVSNKICKPIPQSVHVLMFKMKFLFYTSTSPCFNVSNIIVSLYLNQSMFQCFN